MSRSVSLIIDELAVAAREQDINADDLAEMVRQSAIEEDMRESGESE